MEIICPINQCTACTACYSACPKHAIQMKPDKYGFLYPFINKDLCIDCGICQKVCPANNPLPLNKPKKTIAAYSKDKNDRKSSASGGIASVISDYILKNNGIVYGCVQENVHNIKHCRIDDANNSYKLKDSKYVHSPLENTYKLIRKDLSEGQTVLFIGTPCQCAGLKSYLRNKEYTNLLSIDLCCHGVASQQYLKNEISLIKTKYQISCNDNDLKVKFRRKIIQTDKKGKNLYKIKFGLYLENNGIQIYSDCVPKNNYISGFLSGLFFRPNCFTCHYASSNRISDITLADHWGMGKSSDSEMIVGKGLSTILINTDQGEFFFNKISGAIIYEKRSWEEAINGNGQFLHPFPKPKNYDEFKKDFLKKGYKKSCKKHLLRYKSNYMLNQYKTRLKCLIKSLLFINRK